MKQTLFYKKNNEIMTEICVDHNKETVNIKNYTNDMLDRAFGNNESPSYKDFEDFLEERCFPRNRDKMKFHLRQLELDYYDPYQIVRKTGGKLEGDSYSIVFDDQLKEDNYEYEGEEEYEA